MRISFRGLNYNVQFFAFVRSSEKMVRLRVVQVDNKLHGGLAVYKIYSDTD